jgi:S1-C subfamily serine protease
VIRKLPLLALALVGCTSSRSSFTPLEARVDGEPRSILAASETRAAPTRRQIVRAVLPHNVRVMVSDGDSLKRTASGVVVGVDATSKGAFSYVVTNAHVVEPVPGKQLKLSIVVDREGEAMDYAAEPVAIGKIPDMDLALLRIRGVRLEPAILAEDAELEPGEDVVVVAAPYGRALSVSGGMISQVEWDRRDAVPRLLKTDAAIGYGASGGGVYSRTSGRLVAIVEGYRTAKVGFAVAEQSYSFDVPMPGETFAAPAPKVRAFVTGAGYGRVLQGEPGKLASGAPTINL